MNYEYQVYYPMYTYIYQINAIITSSKYLYILVYIYRHDVG